MNEDRLLNLLRMQERLQRETYKTDILNLEPEARVEYVKNTILAALDELHEALAETSWKPWSSTFGEINEKAFFSELIDLVHFVMNLLLAAFPGMTPDDLAPLIEFSYRQKNALNVQRQADGYDGKTGKCYRCKRALDDTAVECGDVDADDGSMWCARDVGWYVTDGDPA